MTSSTNMDKIIHTAAKKHGEKQMLHPDNRSFDCYFFFIQEETNKAPTRHAIPNKGTIYDYTVGKHYPTLEAWVRSNGRELGDVMYGRRNKNWWVTLDDFACEFNGQMMPYVDTNNDHQKILDDIRINIEIAKKHMSQVDYLMKKLL